MFAASGFFRRVKKPTPTGIKIKTSERQSRTNPTVGGRLELLKLPCPAAVKAPNKQRNRPGQPQRITAAMVAIMPVFLLFIYHLSINSDLSQYIIKAEWDAMKYCIPFVLYRKLNSSTLHRLHAPTV